MLSENIKKYRKKKSLTQESLARKANVSYNTVIKLESGAILDPRIGTLAKISKALDITIDEIII